MSMFNSSSLRLRFLVFALVSALIASAAFVWVREAIRTAHLSSSEKSELHLLRVFKGRIDTQFRVVLSRIQGAELLIASTPPSAATATRALVFAVNRADKNVASSAAVVLDERANILAFRRKGGVPPPGNLERRSWSRAVAALRTGLKNRQEERFHVEVGSLGGIPALFVVAPSLSTRGYWGLILAAEKLFSIGPEENGPGDSVFVLTVPEQTVLFARRGTEFLHDTVGVSFDKELGPRLGISVCCDPAAFNIVSEGRRWMVEMEIPGGTRKFRLIRVADRELAVASLKRAERFLAGGMAAGWALLVGIFALLGKSSGTGRTEETSPPEQPAVDLGPLPENTPFVALNRLSKSVARGDHFKDVISYGTEEAARFVGADRFFAAVYDDDLGQLFEITCSNLGDGFRAAVAIGSQDLPEQIALQKRELVEVPAVADWEDAPDVLKEEGIGAVAVFPMRAGERIVGLMALYFNQPRELDASEVDICGLIALQGAVSVARALSLPEPLPES